MEAGDSHAIQGPLPPPPPPAGGAYFAPTGGALVALRGVPKYLTLRVRGTVHGQGVSVLVDNGATHNFIDAQMVERRGIQTESFNGFSVLVPGDQTMMCARYVPELSVTMGTYTLTDHFFRGRYSRHQHDTGCSVAYHSREGHDRLEDPRDGVG